MHVCAMVFMQKAYWSSAIVESRKQMKLVFLVEGERPEHEVFC